LNFIQRFEANTKGRDFLVGDIHGHFGKLRAALERVGFDKERDRLFAVGDLVDRGPESDEVLAWLAEPWFHSVMGNHEDMAILWAEKSIPATMYLANGGAWNISNPSHQCEVIASAFAALPFAIELETPAGMLGLVHAACPRPSWSEFAAALRDLESGACDLEDMGTQNMLAMAMWDRSKADNLDTTHIEDIFAVVVGHTPVNAVASLGNAVYIDTGAWLHDRPDAPLVLVNAATLEPV
jgi:serine/threonine protein phosphatase 1